VGKRIAALDTLPRGGPPRVLAHGVRLTRDNAPGAAVRWDDVAFDADAAAVKFRREMERVFAA
jgi:predicted homoserine dehydrogenase-like protein